MLSAKKKRRWEKEDQLFGLGEFGDSNPEALQRTVWWLLSLHFGLRARDESRRLKCGDVKLCGDEANGGQFLVWQSERGSKTRNGNGQQRTFNNSTAEATNGERCPARFYNESTRSNERSRSTVFPRYQSQRKARKSRVVSKAPLGKNEIGQFLSKLNCDANSAVNSQVSGLFSGASIGKIKGCTFNIQYVTSEQSTDNKQKADESLFNSDDSDSD